MPPNEFRDDRGAPVRVRRNEVLANVVGSHVSDFELFLGLVARLLPLLLPVSPFVYFLVTGQSWTRGICPAIALFSAGGLARVVILRILRPLAGVSLPFATVLAYGRCAGCGYHLASIPTDRDDRIKCPECGAAWHRDRMPFAHAGQRETIAALRRAAAGSARGRFEVGTVDDRRVMIVTPYKWPRGLLRSVTPAHAAAARKDLDRRLGFPARLVAAFFWCIGIALAVVVGLQKNPTAKDLFGEWTLIAVCCTGIHLATRLARLPAAEVRSVVLRHGCCPSCWGVLAPRVVDFDGRMRCPTCRAAWNAIDINRRSGDRPPPPASPPRPPPPPPSPPAEPSPQPASR